MNKKLLILTFINNDEIDEFLEYISNEFNVDKNKVFIFENSNSTTQKILTFYVEIELGERITLKDHFKNALIVHKKKKVFYTINALNKLIEKVHNLEGGNIDYKKWEIDWTKYENKLILVSNKNLSIIELKRVF